MTTPSQRDTGQVIGLAGILQSAYLVDQIARTGLIDKEHVKPMINSLFQFDAESPQAIYRDAQHENNEGIQLGLRILRDVVGGYRPEEYRATLRYALGILHLQKVVSNNHDMLAIIRSRLEHTALKAAHFTDDSQAIASSCAAIYQDTISTLKFRLQITGSMQQLQHSANADNIRALLLAGIRAAVLWRQMGGRRWQVFLSRKRLLNTAKALLPS